jgi:hypothetical protein
LLNKKYRAYTLLFGPNKRLVLSDEEYKHCILFWILLFNNPSIFV